MRLLEHNDASKIKLTRYFIGDDVPQYAILSHTWGPDTEEVSFKDMIDGTAESKFGYDKIRFCAEQARRDGLRYFWVDTCCIDKSNNTELSEAINSMFRWYRHSTKCYVYLRDVITTNSSVSWTKAFRNSRWFTRGWTLQELIAPTSVEFFSNDGRELGNKKTLEREIQKITGISIEALQGSPLSGFSVKQRMSWIEKRDTTRKEDKAYSLLGIFDVYMPLIYGEGRDNAFKRLREEIDKFLKEQSFSALPERIDAHTERLWSPRQKVKPPRKYQSSTYERLQYPGRSIRLLNLYASSPENPQIECSLVLSEFDEKTGLAAEKYEILSGYWKTAKPSAYINIRQGPKIYAKFVPEDLFHALHSLRRTQKDRFLWINVICIDRENLLEENYQIEMMSQIYGRAERVCIWLGVGSESWNTALTFIKNEVLQFQNFDELCKSEGVSEKWRVLLDFLQHPWFSRRWAIQEIALPRKALLYCGEDKISWSKFAVAVESLVEVGNVTHRLSEVMKDGHTYSSVPRWLEQVSTFGASLLVDAVGKIFREYNIDTRISEDHDSGSESSNSFSLESESDGSDLDSVLYSDGTSNGDSEGESNAGSGVGEQVTMRAKPATPAKEAKKSELNTSKYTVDTFQDSSHRQPLLSLEYLVSSLSVFESAIEHNSIYALLAIAKDASPVASGERFQSALGCVQPILEGFSQRKQYKVEYETPFVDVAGNFVQFCVKSSLYTDKNRALDIICRPWAPEMECRNKLFAKELKGAKPEPSPDEKEISLPSWISRISGASHSICQHAGMSDFRMSRTNSNSLVGLPTLTQPKYNAAETNAIDMKTLRFRKRPKLGHYSLYVKGFELDTIAEVYSQSQNGSIPSEWAKVAGWHQVPKTRPPDAFWRLLVANRGQEGGNPPAYYSRACQDSFLKGGLMSGSVNTTGLIDNNRCSIVVQFCRRVQEVIWNKVLIKTRRGNLGLVGKNVQAGDLVCILYGCSVPVILRRSSEPKSDDDINAEIIEDLREWFKDFRRKLWDKRKRVEIFRQKQRDEKLQYREWESKRRSEWLKDQAKRTYWKERFLNQSFWEEMEDEWALRHNPAAGKKIHQQMPPAERRNQAFWDSWVMKRQDEKKALERIEVRELDMYHSLLQLKHFKSPWKVDKGWWEAYQQTLPDLHPSQHLDDSQSKSKSVCNIMLHFYFWRLEMAKATLPEEREFNQWKAERRGRRDVEQGAAAWNEPSPNWAEFELLIRYGRRWKKHWQTKKTERGRQNPDAARLAKLFRPSFELFELRGIASSKGSSKGSSRAARLAELFGPPLELMYQVPWDVGRAIGVEEKKWILVNVQHPTISDCLALNRDIWKYKGIRELIKENFIFIQYSKDVRENQYIQDYFPTKDDPNAYPYVAIVDPRTGEQVKLWSRSPMPRVEEFLMQLVEFLDRHSPMINKNGNPSVKSQTGKGKFVDVDRTVKDRNELMEWLREERKDYHSRYHFQFFGECYIHGMMNGEGIAVQNDESIAAQVFEVR